MQQKQPNAQNLRQPNVGGEFKKIFPAQGQGISRRSIALVVCGVFCLAALTAWLLWPNPTGTLTVKSDAPTIVLIDGEPQGAAPIENLALAVGTYQITVQHERSGQERTYEKTIKEDEQTKLTTNWLETQLSKKAKKSRNSQKILKNSAKRNRTKAVKKKEESNEPY